MSSSDSPPQPPFMPPHFAGGHVSGLWPQTPMNNEALDSNLQFDHAPPFKRPRNSAPFPPMNPRMTMPNPHGNRGTGHIFYKTRMCLKFMEGNCRNGDHCTFAHGPEDLREPPPNWQEIVAAREKDRAAGNWNDDQRIIHRMKICKKFYNGEVCPYGDKCSFLHEDPSKFKNETGRPRESSGITFGIARPMMGHGTVYDQPESNKHVNATSDAFRVNMKPVYWKTKLCSKWEITGQCPFGDRCYYAHGQSDLQLPGDCFEAEAVNAFIVPTKPVFVPGNDVPIPPPSKATLTARAKEDGEGKKCLSKWKGTKKINRIYADWIDDLTPPRTLPNKVERQVYV